MIKKMFKNRLAMGVMAATLVVLLGLGATYAWFIAQAKIETNIEMGDLRINAVFDNASAEIYQPGDTATSSGKIKNVGNVAAIISVKGASEVAFKYSDNNFNPWTGAEWIPDYEKVVKSTLNGSTSGVGYDENYVLSYAWFYDINKPNEKYLLLAPDKEISLTIKSVLDGDTMENKYNRAKIKVGNDINATQTYDGALKSLFGISNDDLELYFGESRSKSVDSIPEVVLEQINQLMGRN